MKVLMINGSPRQSGNTATALAEMQKVFEKNGVEVEIFEVGTKTVKGCVACRYCHKNFKCAIDDGIVNELAKKLEECDGLVIGSPVYYAAPNATLLALLDRLFYSTGAIDKRMKVGAAVVVARRSGISSSLDCLNKYFTISGMPIASSTYWNGLHGRLPAEAAEDLEGMQTTRTLAENMTFLMKSIALGKEKYGMPEREDKVFYNFVR